MRNCTLPSFNGQAVANLHSDSRNLAAPILACSSDSPSSPTHLQTYKKSGEQKRCSLLGFALQ